MSKKIKVVFQFFQRQSGEVETCVIFSTRCLEKSKHGKPSISMTQVGTDHIEHAPILEDLFDHFERVALVKYLP